MNALTTPIIDATEADRVLLQDVSWEEYERLSDEYPDSASLRFTYDSGNLEIMTISAEHEAPNRRLASLLETILVEWDIDFEAVGSNTFRRRDLAKGFEPHSSFYIEHAAAIRGKKRIDLRFDPPPDLVIEVALTRSLVAKLPIFAAVGVPEIWQWDGDAVQILRLAGTEYRQVRQSGALKPLGAKELTSFLEKSTTMTRPTWTRAVRAWAQAHSR